MTRVAIIDLGTNTFHLLIAAIDRDKVTVLHKEKQSVKIGEQGISHGLIAEPAQERAIHTLQEFKQKIDSLSVNEVHATATSAFRNASNGQELADKISRLTGIKIDIIDGDREAHLIYKGVRQALNTGADNALIMDIGGGSVEFIITEKNQVKWVRSFEIGAQRLMDKFHHQDPITPQEIENLELFLDSQLTELINAYHQFQPTILIGASGTFDTLSQIYSLQRGLNFTDQPEQPLTISGFNQIHQDIVRKNRAERMAIPGMIEMRVDMIVVASSLINYILKKLPIDEIRVSTYALKEGLLSEVSGQLRSTGS